MEEKTEKNEKSSTIIVSKCIEFRINLTEEQRILIWKTFGCCRFVWNHLLDDASAMRRLTKASSSILLLHI